MKVKFNSSGTWVALGVFDFQVIARQAVLVPSMGTEPAYGQAQKLPAASPPSSHRDCRSPEGV